MNEVTSSVLDARAAGAYARSEALVPSGPVRPADPVKPRFTVIDGGKTAQTGTPAPFVGDDESGGQTAARQPAADTPRGGRGPGLLGALTSFLARTFGQVSEGEGIARSTFLSGLRAYTRSAPAQGAADKPGIDVLPPGFPRLSSGRAVDLSV